MKIVSNYLMEGLAGLEPTLGELQSHALPTWL